MRKKKIIEALVSTAVAIHVPGDMEKGDTVQFVQDQLNRFPDYLRLPFIIVTHLFNLSSIIIRGKTFTMLSVTGQVKVYEMWERSSIRFCRDYCKVFKTLVLFNVYSRENAK